MAATLTAPPRAPLAAEATKPPRPMAESARRGKRKRAWPRWFRPALRGAGFAAIGAAVIGSGWVAWREGVFDAAYEIAESFVVETTGGAGFLLSEVLVEGRRATDRDTLLTTLGIRRGDPIFGIDLAEARERLQALPWVESVAIERRLPDLLYLRLSEREPLAIWQNEHRLTVIDRAGRPLADATELARKGNRTIETLPHVVGPDAPQHVEELLAALAEAPDVAKRLTAAQRIGNRRWDLRLDNGIVVKLPEEDMAEAIRRLAAVQARERLFERDIVVVDLRIADRLVLQTSAAPVVEDAKKKAGKKS